MKKKHTHDVTPDKTLAAVCGLFCPSCTLYIGTQEDPARLEWLAQQMDRPVEDLHCHGCRAEQRSYYCQTCAFVTCAADKGVDFCGACPDYPCQDLQRFQAEMPHRIELWQNLDRIQEAGYETWYQEMVEHASCAACHTINSAYDIACRKCGVSPSSPYVQRHQDTIEAHLKK